MYTEQSLLVGIRNKYCVGLFMRDVEEVFGGEIRYAILVKLYGNQLSNDENLYLPLNFKKLINK